MSIIKKKRILLEKEFKDNLTKLNSSLDSFKYSSKLDLIINQALEYIKNNL